jgi:hypothetical protein
MQTHFMLSQGEAGIGVNCQGSRRNKTADLVLLEESGSDRGGKDCVKC